MVKKNVLTALISILTIFVIAGCSNSGNAAAPNGNAKGGYKKPDIYGEVSAINGNKVTLKLLKTPQMSRQNGQVRGSNNGNMGTNTAGNTGGNGSLSGGPGGSGGPRGGGMRVKTYTGEEKTIVIPDGVSMTTMTRGANGMAQSDISLNEVTTGSTLSIYYDTDGKTIKSIRVQKPRTDNGQTGNTGN